MDFALQQKAIQGGTYDVKEVTDEAIFADRSVEETLEALHQPSQKETNLNIPEAAMRDHLPLDQDDAVGSLPVFNIWASTATPQLKLGELTERTKYMARGGGDTQENDRFDDKDTMVETGNYAAHQPEGLLEDLEVDIESPSSHCDSGNFIVEPVAIEGDQTAVLSFAADNSVTAIKIGQLVVEGRENGYNGCNDEGKIKSAMLEVKPGQVFVLPLAEEVAVAPNNLSRLPGVQDSPFPTKHSSEAERPSSAHPTNCLQHPQMSSLLSKALLRKEPGQEQSLVTTLVLRPPRGGAPEQDIGANQLLSSFRVNPIDPICTWCTGASEMLNHENALSNTSIAEYTLHGTSTLGIQFF
ncbi:unnamed protein product [Sphagnum troendelagicum]|uniref:Uncharacterized protein n=1 Tax=Sphagnum troendelagicum TaxID=128251 RepID=A0ABP0TQ17_9BRYO